LADINELFSPEALKSVSDLQITFASIVTTIDSLVAKSKTLDQLLSTMTKTADAQNQLGKAAKESVNLNKQLADSEDEVVKAKIRYSNAVKEQKTELSAQVAMEEAAADSMVAMKAKLAALKTEYNNASGAIRDKMAPALKSLTTEIQKAEQATGVHTRGVGNYANSILQAAGQLVGFTSVAGIATAVLNQLKDAFLATEAGMSFMKQAKSAIATYFQTIIAGNLQLAASNATAAAAIASQMDDLRIQEREEKLHLGTLENDIKLLRLKGASTKDLTAQLAIYHEADAKENEVIKIKGDFMQKEMGLMDQMIGLRPTDSKLLDERNNLQIEYNNLTGDKNLRIQTKIAADEAKIDADKLKAIKDKLDAEKKYQEFRDSMTKNNTELQETALKGSEKAWADEVTGEKTVDDFKSKEMDILGIKKQDLMIQEPKWLEKQVKDDAKIQKKANDDEIKLAEEKYKLIGQIEKQGEQLVNNIIDGKIQKLEDAKNIELSNANLTAAQKTAIDKKYADEEGKLKRKAAIADKAEALFKIAIDTAANITKNPLLMPFYLALAATEAAVVISKPLPAYAKGTMSAIGGPSVVGEHGKELMISPSGQIGLTPDNPAIMDITRGTKIIPSEETKRILNVAMGNKNTSIETAIERGNKEIVQAIKNKRELILNYGIGHKITERKGNRYVSYFETHIN
jgi:hypothetical protein